LTIAVQFFDYPKIRGFSIDSKSHAAPLHSEQNIYVRRLRYILLYQFQNNVIAALLIRK